MAVIVLSRIRKWIKPNQNVHLLLLTYRPREGESLFEPQLCWRAVKHSINQLFLGLLFRQVILRPNKDNGSDEQTQTLRWRSTSTQWRFRGRAEGAAASPFPNRGGGGSHQYGLRPCAVVMRPFVPPPFNPPPHFKNPGSATASTWLADRTLNSPVTSGQSDSGSYYVAMAMFFAASE